MYFLETGDRWDTRSAFSSTAPPYKGTTMSIDVLIVRRGHFHKCGMVRLQSRKGSRRGRAPGRAGGAALERRGQRERGFGGKRESRRVGARLSLGAGGQRGGRDRSRDARRAHGHRGDLGAVTPSRGPRRRLETSVILVCAKSIFKQDLPRQRPPKRGREQW